MSDLAATLVVLAYIPAVLFPLIYGLAYPWYRNPVGWSVLNLSVVIPVALSLSMWRAFFGAPADGFRIAVFGWIVVALWGQLLVLLAAPRMNRRRLRRKPGR